jgi:hypothetical protein
VLKFSDVLFTYNFQLVFLDLSNSEDLSLIARVFGGKESEFRGTPQIFVEEFLVFSGIL